MKRAVIVSLTALPLGVLPAAQALAGALPGAASPHEVLGPAFWIAVAVLAATYVLIAFEFVHRTLAAFLGAALVLLVSYTAGLLDPAYFVISWAAALRAIDWNVIFLLLGMMVIVGVLKETGLFHWLAHRSFRLSGGRVFLLAAILMCVTAVLSAFLDNVTTMLLICPVTIEVCLALGLPPAALLIPEVLASNLGGAATLIGDPPNIMIGSHAGLSFNHFLEALGPVVVLAMAMQLIMTRLYYGRQYAAAEANPASVASRDLWADAPEGGRTVQSGFEATCLDMHGRCAIKDARLLKVGLSVLAVVILLFFLQGVLRMPVSVAALGGAAVLLAFSRAGAAQVLRREVEWPTLVFFMMLFIIAGAAEEVGLLRLVADWVERASGGSLIAAVLIVAWASAFMSGVVDNIPFTATMLPVVAHLSRTVPGAESMVLWWALALGACFGGNGTLIGASANVVTAGLMEKAGHPISFGQFMKIGLPVMLLSMVIASLWLVFVLR